MKTRILTTTIALCILPALHLCAQSTSPFLVTHTRDTDSNFSELTLELKDATSTLGDLTFGYNISGSSGQGIFQLSNTAGEWIWQKNGVGPAVQQMRLGNDGVLTLNGTPTGGVVPFISLDPTNQSITLTDAAGSQKTVLTLSAADARYIQLGGALTQTAADARYLQQTGDNITVGNITASGGITASSLSLGGQPVYSQASNDLRYLRLSSSTSVSLAVGSSAATTPNAMSFAFGTGAQAFGTANLAFGTNARTITNTSNALALGYNAYASNNNTIAIGYNASAMATGAAALGYSNFASGDYSTAMGNNTYAQGYSQFVVGRYNVMGGSYSSYYWSGTDDLFIVGNGATSSTRSNAFTVKQNGDTNVNFALYVRDPAYQTDTTAKGAKISYSDKYGGNPNASQTLFNGNRASSEWRFQHPNSYGTTYDAMKLDSSHVLHLFDTMGSMSSVIRLDPGNGSGSTPASIKLYNQAYTSTPTVQISPGNTTTPASLNLYNSNTAVTPTIQISPGNTTGTTASITVAGSNVITQATGDSRYLLLGMSVSTGLASGTGSSAGTNAVALGSNAQATYDSSVAIGSGAQAQNQGATALGSSASAVGMYSAAIGHLNSATGDFATALGYGTTAQGFSQFVVGSYNVASQGLQTTWDDADELFTVGNGTSESNRSNAFVVRKNANATIGTGLESTTASQLVVGRYNDTTFDRTSGAFIVATGDKTEGVITRKNALRVTDDGAVLVAQSGDISMGEFTAGPQP